MRHLSSFSFFNPGEHITSPPSSRLPKPSQRGASHRPFGINDSPFFSLMYMPRWPPQAEKAFPFPLFCMGMAFPPSPFFFFFPFPAILAKVDQFIGIAHFLLFPTASHTPFFPPPPFFFPYFFGPDTGGGQKYPVRMAPSLFFSLFSISTE